MKTYFNKFNLYLYSLEPKLTFSWCNQLILSNWILHQFFNYNISHPYSIFTVWQHYVIVMSHFGPRDVTET